MSADRTLGELAGIIAAVSGADASTITPDQDLQQGLGLASLSMVEVIVAAERRFGISLPDERLGGMRTVGDLVALVDQASTSS